MSARQREEDPDGECRGSRPGPRTRRGSPPDPWGEFRRRSSYRVRSDTLAAEFLPAHDQSALAAAIGRRSASTDVYVGCAPRRCRSGTKNDIAQVWVLWAECDGEAAARAAAAYFPRPAIVIASGSGSNVHAYWPLRDPLSARDAEHANLRLARALGADLACFDASRILRPPGTWNHKRQPPSPVAALRVDPSVSFAAREVVARAPEIDRGPIERRWTDHVARQLGGDSLLRLAPAVYVAELLGVTARAGRKVHCPFHTDQRPSLHVYPSAARGWSCFSCGRGGSIYDLAAAIWGIGTRGRDFVELRHRLQERFAHDLARTSRSLER